MTVPLGPSRPAMDLSCGRLLDGSHCGRLSVQHVLWSTDMRNGVMCGEHWGEAQRRWPHYDAHPVDAFCTMPGSEWYFSWDHPPGYCVIPIDDETAAAVLEAELRAGVETS
jgi:hypothetical protein